MQFRVKHLLLAAALVAVFFAMRRWWITSEDDRVAGLTPIIIAVCCGVWLGSLHRKALIIVGGSFVGGLLAGLPFALEAVYHSPDTEFLRRNWPQDQYNDDAALNAIAVLAVAGVSTIIGSSAGLIARLLIRTVGQEEL